jgi:hypothetical protein
VQCADQLELFVFCVRLIGEAKRQADEKDSVQCIRSGLKRTPNGFFTGFAWSPDFDQKTKEAMTTDPLKSSSLLFILLLFKSFKQVSGHLVSDFRTTFANHDARRSTAARYVFGTRSYEQVVRKFSSKRKVRIVRPKVRDRRKQECKSEFFTGKGESMTLSLLANVRFLRRKN